MPLSIRNVVSLMPISYSGFQLNTSLTLLKTWTRHVLLVLVFILAYVDLCSLINRLYGLTFLTPEVPKSVCSAQITDDPSGLFPKMSESTRKECQMLHKGIRSRDCSGC